MPSPMKQFWDRRADEDPFYFVDNRLDYRNPDLERFWSEGEEALDNMLRMLDLEIRPTDRIVEIGCGIGRLTRVLAARGRNVRALDVSAKMLEHARRHNGHLSNIEWILGDGATLGGIETGSADICISHVVFQHIPDKAIVLQYVQEMGRVLRPGGIAAFQFSNDRTYHHRRSLLARVKQTARAAVVGAPRGQHNPFWTGSMLEIDEIRHAAEAGALTITRLVGEGTALCCVRAMRAS